MNASSGQSGQPLSTSMFYMWRCVIAIAHADGRVDAAERAYLDKVIAGMDRAFGLTDEQRRVFGEDLRTAQKIDDLLPYINDPAARGQIIYFGALLARADGVVDVEEEAVLARLHAEQMSALNMEKIRADVKKAVADEMFRHDLSQSALRPQSGLSAVLDELLLRLGIDLLD